MESIHNLEIAITLFLQSLGSWVQAPANFFSFLGSEEFYFLIMPVLYWCIDASMGFRIGLILTISISLNAVLKLGFHSPRLYWIDPRVHAYALESTFGLPSGHAQNAAAIWGLIGVLIHRAWLVWVSGIVIVLIGFSRVILGVHFFSDVLLGWLVGGLILWLFVRFDEPVLAWVRRQSTRRLFAVCLLSSLGIMLMIFLVDQALGRWNLPEAWVTRILSSSNELLDPRSLNGAFTSSGIWFGLTAGSVWMFRSSGGFRPLGKMLPAVLCYLIGLIGVLLLWNGLGAIFPREDDIASFTLRYLRYALLGAWVTAGAPLLFKRFSLVK